MSELEAKAIPGTEIKEGIANPVFSPEGHAIAFWTNVDGTLKRIRRVAGPP